MKKNILIIGEKGYIGSRLINELKKFHKIKNFKISEKIDIKSYKNLKKYITKELDIVINLSGQISQNINLMKNVIIKGNKNLIRLCKQNNVSVYYISSSLIYGYSDIPKKESSRKHPTDSYSKFKLIAEKDYLKSNMNFKIIRLSNVYNGKKNGIAELLINSIKNNKKINLTNKNAYRNYIHINDTIKILSKMIKKKLNYNIYNLGYENIKLINLIRGLENKINKDIDFYDRKISLPKISSQKIDTSRLYTEIKYKPKINILDYITNNILK